MREETKWLEFKAGSILLKVGIYKSEMERIKVKKRFIWQNSRFLKIDRNDKLRGNKIFFVSCLETCYIK